MSPRTVTVRLADGSTVTVDEPDWCSSRHEDGLALEDLFHEGPELTMSVPTGRGEVRVLNAALTQYPYAVRPEDRRTVVTVLLADDWRRFDPDGLRDLAARLVVYAGSLRDLGRELAAVRASEAGR